MARRAAGGRARIVPGVVAAVADYSRRFGRTWDAPDWIEGADLLDSGQPAYAQGDEIHAAMFAIGVELPELAGDHTWHRISPGDRVEPVEP
jgi:hypothetical protein